jgi:SsrA-binding protein
MKVLQVNKKAYRDYEVLEKLEAGIKLQGAEVKALKEGRGNLKGSYIRFSKNKPLLVGFSLPAYSKSAEVFHYEPARSRDLLLNTHEIKSLLGMVAQKGYTVTPLKIYANERGLIKVLIGVAKGKQKAEKKDDLIKKQQERAMRKTLKNTRY